MNNSSGVLDRVGASNTIGTLYVIVAEIEGELEETMILPNKLNITHQAALARAEEEISKRKAKQLFDSGDIGMVGVGTYEGLAFIHRYLFGEITPSQGN